MHNHEVIELCRPAIVGGSGRLQWGVLHLAWLPFPLSVVFIAVRTLLILALGLCSPGCVYRLQAYNPPGREKLHIVASRRGEYTVRIGIEGGAETPVPADGRVAVDVPRLPRGCSPYLFGLIKLGDGSPERLRAIHVLRNGKVLRKLSLDDLQGLPLDEDGYRLLRF